MVDRAHLGEGIAFPLRLTVQGSVQLSQNDRNIEESIQIILRTQPGERVYRPDFGCRLADLTFAPMNTQTLLMVRLYIQEALEKWEPRIVIDEIRTDPDPMRGRVDVNIIYHPRESHDRRSLVFPFYLLPPG